MDIQTETKNTNIASSSTTIEKPLIKLPQDRTTQKFPQSNIAKIEQLLQSIKKEKQQVTVLNQNDESTTLVNSSSSDDEINELTKQFLVLILIDLYILKLFLLLQLETGIQDLLPQIFNMKKETLIINFQYLLINYTNGILMVLVNKKYLIN